MTNYVVQVLKEQRETVSKKIAELNAELRTYKEKLQSLDDGISRIDSNYEPPVTRTRTTSGVGLKELVLAELPIDGDGATPIEISKKLTENGRQTNNTTVSSTLNRLKSDELAISINGKWFKTKKETSEYDSDISDLI
ncbi:MAG: hypothetical protein JNL76_08260 [Alphaproteobacteria bacterium]|nr:hypothetical protein [Alphaproteobacteria bacterium]